MSPCLRVEFCLSAPPRAIAARFRSGLHVDAAQLCRGSSSPCTGSSSPRRAGTRCSRPRRRRTRRRRRTLPAADPAKKLPEPVMFSTCCAAGHGHLQLQRHAVAHVHVELIVVPGCRSAPFTAAMNMLTSAWPLARHHRRIRRTHRAVFRRRRSGAGDRRRAEWVWRVQPGPLPVIPHAELTWGAQRHIRAARWAQLLIPVAAHWPSGSRRPCPAGRRGEPPLQPALPGERDTGVHAPG